jgi:AcrR family transcriptional regulator
VPRTDRSDERRAELLPIVAGTFAELGYRRATNAELAQRCGVQETILYRLWPDKKAMFLAAIGHVFDISMAIWTETTSTSADGSPAEQVLAYEAEHHGELGLYRILFAGLNEFDDPEIREALRTTYRRFKQWIEERVVEHRGRQPAGDAHPISADDAAWAAVALGTIINIGRDLDLLSSADRARLLDRVGRLLLDSKPSAKGSG